MAYVFLLILGLYFNIKQGGDLTASTAATFEDCIADCDQTPGCIDVSYVAPSCYMKSELGTPSYNHVWTAKVLQSAQDTFTFPTVPDRPLKNGIEEDTGGPYVYPDAPVATLTPSPPPGESCLCFCFGLR